MFPYIQSEYRNSFDVSSIHQRIVLVGGGDDLELAAVDDEPDPPGAEAADATGFELLLEGVEGTEAPSAS